MAVCGGETWILLLAGKKIHHCLGCPRNSEKGEYVWDDNLIKFLKGYDPAEDILEVTPV